MALQPGSFPPHLPGPHLEPDHLPLGLWNLMANGRAFKLDIRDVNGSRVDAVFSSGDAVDVIWNAAANKFTFIRVLPNLKQKFEGYLLHFSAEDPMWRMAGTYGNVEVGVQSGWYATIPR